MALAHSTDTAITRDIRWSTWATVWNQRLIQSRRLDSSTRTPDRQLSTRLTQETSMHKEGKKKNQTICTPRCERPCVRKRAEERGTEIKKIYAIHPPNPHGVLQGSSSSKSLCCAVSQSLKIKRGLPFACLNSRDKAAESF